jgi:hypothetical protein
VEGRRDPVRRHRLSRLGLVRPPGRTRASSRPAAGGAWRPAPGRAQRQSSSSGVWGGTYHVCDEQPLAARDGEPSSGVASTRAQELRSG